MAGQSNKTAIRNLNRERFYASVVEFPRAPTGTDTKNKNTGERFNTLTYALDTSTGDLWYLAAFNAGVADWRKLADAEGAVTTLLDQVDAQVDPNTSGQINVDGSTVNNAANPSGIPLETVAGTNTLTIQQQVATARTGAPGDKNDAGICSFDDTAFSVDGDGYVTLAGGSGPAVDSVDVDFNTAPGTDPVVPTAAGVMQIYGNTVTNGTNAAAPVATHSRAANQFHVDVQLAADRTGAPANPNDAGMCSFDDTEFVVDANGYVSLVGASGAPAIQKIDGDGGGAVGPNASGTVFYFGQVVANGTRAKPLWTEDTPGSNQMDFELQVATARTGAPGDKLDAGIASFDDTYFTCDTDGYVSLTTAGSNLYTANYIVDPAGLGSNYTTITAALAAASSGDTIAVKPGTYTEDLTLKAGVNITAWGSDGMASLSSNVGNVVIDGKCSATFNGTCSISGVTLQTNLDYCLEVTGTNPTNIQLVNCFIAAADNTALNISSSGSGCRINMYGCRGDSFTTGVSLFDNSSVGQVNLYNCIILNNASSSTACTVSSGTFGSWNSRMGFAVTTSSTGGFNLKNSIFAKPLTANGTGVHGIAGCELVGDSSTALTLGASAAVGVSSSTVTSTNTNAIGGTGTLTYQGLSFSASSNQIAAGLTTASNYMQLGSWRAEEQPSFLAYLGTTDSNVTGNGAAYVLGSGNALTEVFDPGGDFAVGGSGTATFTAPVTGKYLLTYKIALTGFTAATTPQYQIITSNRTYEVFRTDTNTSGSCTYEINVIADMDASDTATYLLDVSGEASDLLDVVGAADMRTMVSGMLVA